MCLCCSPATNIRFSRIEANVYPRGVKHIVLNILQKWENQSWEEYWTFGALTLYVLRLAIVYLYNKGSHVTFFKFRCFISF